MHKLTVRQNSPFSQTWAGWARSLRAKFGTQREVARICGVDHSYVSLWIDGFVPSRKIINKIAKNLPADEASNAYRAAGYISQGVA